MGAGEGLQGDARVLIAQYAPEGAAAAVLLLAPPVLGVASFWPSARGHWSGAVLAAPSLRFGLAFTAAVLRDGPGLAGWAALAYGPLLLILAVASFILWDRRRASRSERC